MTEVIATIAAAVSALVAILAFMSARRQREATERSAAAAETSAAHAQRSAAAAERMASIEEDREHQSRRPDIDLSFPQWLSQHATATLKVVNRSGTAVSSTQIELVQGSPLTGFGDEPPYEHQHKIYDLEPGTSHDVAFTTGHVGNWDKNLVTFRITVTGENNRQWDPWLAHVELPPLMLVPRRLR